MERLSTTQPKGLSHAGIRKWAMIFTALGIFGRSILQLRYLGLGDMTSDQLLEAMSSGASVMTVVTISLVLQFVETCAVPLFCFLLAEGFQYTSNADQYLGRIAALAVISEIPYNLAMGGKIFDISSRNPVFGLLVAILVLYLFKHFAKRKITGWLVKAAVVLAALVWCAMLRIEHGIPCVILTVAFWACRKKPMIRNLVGGGAAMLCCVYSIFYAVSPMSVMVLHFHNGEKGEENKVISYLLYPVLLIVFTSVGSIAL